MYKCDVCHKTFENVHSFSGHRSGHSRRGEMPKVDYSQRKYKSRHCDICDLNFELAKSLSAHRKLIHGEWITICNDRKRKLRLLFVRGHKCEVCKNSEWMGKRIPIEIDHIDGNPENSSEENYRLICPNCHAQTETYRGRNIGKVKNSKRATVLKKYYGKYR